MRKTLCLAVVECIAFNGFEHQVAGHMIWEGLRLAGLAIERAVHDRYHASRRNPWNEIERGYHDGCGLAGYGVHLAACGFENHGPKQHIGCAPKLTPKNFNCAFTSAEGWGSLHLKTIALASGAHSAKFIHPGKPVGVQLQRDGKRVLIPLKNSVKISAGEKLEIVLA